MANYKEIAELADTHGDEAVILLTQHTQHDIIWARLMQAIDYVSDCIKNKDTSDWIVPAYSSKHFYYRNSGIERTGDVVHCEFSVNNHAPVEQIVIKGRIV